MSQDKRKKRRESHGSHGSHGSLGGAKERSHGSLGAHGGRVTPIVTTASQITPIVLPDEDSLACALEALAAGSAQQQSSPAAAAFDRHSVASTAGATKQDVLPGAIPDTPKAQAKRSGGAAIDSLLSPSPPRSRDGHGNEEGRQEKGDVSSPAAGLLQLPTSVSARASEGGAAAAAAVAGSDVRAVTSSAAGGPAGSRRKGVVAAATAAAANDDEDGPGGDGGRSSGSRLNRMPITSITLHSEQWDDGDLSPVEEACCLPFQAVFSKEARANHQKRWRKRLHAALRSADAAELGAWVKHYRGLLGPRGTGEMEAALWAAVERGSAPLVRVLVSGGANCDMTAAAANPKLPAKDWKLHHHHPYLRHHRSHRAVDAIAHTVSGIVAAAAASFGPSRTSSRRVAAAAAAAAATATAASATTTAAASGAKEATGGGEGGDATSPSHAGSTDSLTLLMLAVKRGVPAVVEHLLSAGGAHVAAKQPDYDDWTALHHAVLMSPPAGGGAGAATGAHGDGGSSTDDGTDSNRQLRCLDLALKALGTSQLSLLRTAAAAARDTLPRFAVRCGRAAAVQAIVAAGGEVEDPQVPGDEGSCAWLAGFLGLTVEVWDLPVPDPMRPRTRERETGRDGWVRTPAEQTAYRQRRQLLCGAAAAGRVAVIERVLGKPHPYDTLLAEELDEVMAACGVAPPDPDAAAGAPTGAAAAAVAAAAAAAAPLAGLAGRARLRSHLQGLAHRYLDLQGEVLPAMRALDVAAAGEWLDADLPPPSAVDAALAAALSAERLLLTAPQRRSKLVELLLHYGADVNTSWCAGTGEEKAQLRPLTAAVRVGAASLVSQLLASGADPLLLDSRQENAVMTAVRAAATEGLPALTSSAGVRSRSPGLSLAAGSLHEPEKQEADWSACLAALLGHDRVSSQLLNAHTSAEGLTAAMLAAVLDQPRCLELLCGANANPWANPSAPLPGAPSEPLKELYGRWAPQLQRAAGKWSVVHEAARHGSLGALRALLELCDKAAPLPPNKHEWELPGPSSTSPAPDSAAQGAACARRDALVGAIRGGRVGAARLALEPDRNGLYEEELVAAEALLSAHAEAHATAGGPTGLNHLYLAGTGAMPTADPAAYDALRAYLRSRKHVYLDWEVQVVPRLRAYDTVGVSQWLYDDRVSPARATEALALVVREALPAGCDRVGSSSTEHATGDDASGGDNGKKITDVVDVLLQAGADVNHEEGPEGLSLLILATRNGHDALVSHLLAKGALVTATDAAGYSAADHAVAHMRRHGHSRCLAVLLKALGGAVKLNAHRAPCGATTLGLAVWAGDVEASRLLLDAGADPLLTDSRGDNALMTAVRAAAARGVPTLAQQGMAVLPLLQTQQRQQLQQQKPQGQGESSGDNVGDSSDDAMPTEELHWEGCLRTLLRSPGVTGPVLDSRTNNDGQTAALLAAVLDQPRCLELLCGANANPWANPSAPLPGAPSEPLKELYGRWAPQLQRAAGKWSVVHEAARHGSLGALRALLELCDKAAPTPASKHDWELPGPSSASPAPDSAAQGAACARRDALVGAIRGGRVGAARLALEPDRNGLYEEELEAADALLSAHAEAHATAGGPTGLNHLYLAGTGAMPTADPAAYDALRAYLRSRKHVYLDWEVQVVPRLRSYDTVGVSQWLYDDRVSPARATEALALVVREALPGGGSKISANNQQLHFVVDVLVGGGADVNNEDGQDVLPLLILATRNGHDALVSHLLAKGALVTATDAAGYSAADHAVAHMRRHGHSRCLAVLLKALGGAAKLNAHRVPCGATTLGLAVWAGDVEASRLLLDAGADPLLTDSRGDNALMTAVRAAASRGVPTLAQQGMAVLPLLQTQQRQQLHQQEAQMPPLQLRQPAQDSDADDTPDEVAATPDNQADWEGCLRTLLDSPVVTGAVLNSRTNDESQTVALLAAVLDQPACLKLLWTAGANPWAKPVVPPAGTPEAPKELYGRWAPQLQRAAGKWSVVHEAARHGSLGALRALLELCDKAAPLPPNKHEWELPAPSSTSPAPDSAAQGAACARRDALVGAIRGGRVGAARLALEPDRNGLYEEELEAAEALLSEHAAAAAGAAAGSQHQATGALAAAAVGTIVKLQPLGSAPPASSPATAAGGAAGEDDSPAYDALRAYLCSRKHVYLDWESCVIKRLRSYDTVGVSQWLYDDRVSPARATEALALVVREALPSDSGHRDSWKLCRMVDVLVGGGANINDEVGKDFLSLLMLATRNGHDALVSHLLAKGALVTATDAAGYSAADHAVAHMRRHGHRRCLAVLLKALGGAVKLNAHRAPGGATTLGLAVWAGDVEASRLLLDAGADPLLTDSRGDNALMTAVRAAAARGVPSLAQQGMPGLGVEAASASAPASADAGRAMADSNDDDEDEYEEDFEDEDEGDSAGARDPGPDCESSGNGGVGPGAGSIPALQQVIAGDWAGCLGVLLKGNTVPVSAINSRTNHDGQTAALLAAVLDQPACLKLVCDHSGNPWAVPVTPPSGAPTAPKELYGRWAPQLQRAAGKWSVVHEAARHGSLGALRALLELCERAEPQPAKPAWAPGAYSAAPDSSLQGVRCARRDALIGAIRGGRVGAARLVLEPDPNGLYEHELRAAEAFLDSCSLRADSSSNGAPVPSVAAAAADGPPAYDALRAYLRSRKHTYQSWQRDVFPKLKSYDVDAVSQWLYDDRVPPKRATYALRALVDHARLEGGTSGSSSYKTSSRLCDTVNALLAGGAQLNYVFGKLRLTLLMMATLNGHDGLISHLLAQGAYVTATDAAGYNALDHAVAHMRRHGHRRCLEALLKSSYTKGSADELLNRHRTRVGDTTLALAIRVGNLEAAGQLMEAGADPLAGTVDAGGDGRGGGKGGGRKGGAGTRGKGKGGGGDGGGGDSIGGSNVKSAAYLAGFFGSSAALSLMRPHVASSGKTTSVSTGSGAVQGPKARLERMQRDAVLGAVGGGQLELLEKELLKTPAELDSLSRLAPSSRKRGTGASPYPYKQMEACRDAGRRLADTAKAELDKLREPLSAARDIARKLQGQQLTAGGGAARYRVAQLTERYLEAKSKVLEKLQQAHAGTADRYAAAVTRLQAVEKKKKDRTASMRSAVTARQRRLAGLADEQVGKVTARCDEQLKKIKAMAERKQEANMEAAKKKYGELDRRRGGPQDVEAKIESSLAAARRKIKTSRDNLESSVSRGNNDANAAQRKLNDAKNKLARWPASAPGRGVQQSKINDAQRKLDNALSDMRSKAARAREQLDAAANRSESQAAAGRRKVEAYREKLRTELASCVSTADSRVEAWSTSSQLKVLEASKKQLNTIDTRVGKAKADLDRKLSSAQSQLDRWELAQGQKVLDGVDTYAAAAEKLVGAMVSGAGRAFIDKAVAKRGKMAKGAGKVKNINPWKLALKMLKKFNKDMERERERMEENQALEQALVADAMADILGEGGDEGGDEGGEGGEGWDAEGGEGGEGGEAEGGAELEELQGRDAWEQEAVWQELSLEDTADMAAAGADDGGGAGLDELDAAGADLGGGGTDAFLFDQPAVVDAGGDDMMTGGGLEDCGGGGDGDFGAAAELQLPPELEYGSSLPSDADLGLDLNWDAGSYSGGSYDAAMPDLGSLPDLDLGSLPDVGTGGFDAGLGNLDVGSMDIPSINIPDFNFSMDMPDINVEVPDIQQIDIPEPVSMPIMPEPDVCIPDYVAPPVYTQEPVYNNYNNNNYYTDYSSYDNSGW